MYKLLPAGDEGRGVRNINSVQDHLHTWCFNFQSSHLTERKSDPPIRIASAPTSGFNRHKKLHGRKGWRGTCGKTAAGLLWISFWAGFWAEVEDLRLDGTGNRKMTEPKAVFSCLFIKEGRVDWLTVSSLQGARGLTFLYISHAFPLLFQ